MQQQQQQQQLVARPLDTPSMCLAQNPTEMEQNGKQTLELELEL